MMKNLILILFLTSLVPKAKSQIDSTNFWQFSPRVGYDFPNYKNQLHFVDYMEGVQVGFSTDKYWKWYGFGADFDYIQNSPENQYPTKNLFYLNNSTELGLPDGVVQENQIKRWFAGIGPSFKFQSKNNQLVAELNTRAGVGGIKGGLTKVTSQDPISAPTANQTLILNEHAGYNGSMIFSYKSQVRLNYYFAPSFGLSIGGYYLNHTNISEDKTPGGIVEQFFNTISTNSSNEIVTSVQNIRYESCDCEVDSFGTFVGLSFSPSKKQEENQWVCNHTPTCTSPCTPCCPSACTTCSNFAIRVNVENKSTGERIYDANIELTADDGFKLEGDSSDRGGRNFEEVKKKSYSAFATLDSLKSTIVNFDAEELVSGQVITKTVFINDEPIPSETKTKTKKVTIIVKDRPTGQVIPNSDVIVKDNSGALVFTGTTNSLGAIMFDGVSAQDYSIEGKVFGIQTTNNAIASTEFDTQNAITKELFYEDLRFILKGKTVDTYTRIEKPDVTVSLKNDQSNSVNQSTSSSTGDFNFRLDKQTSYTVQGQKRGEFSEIETVSTIGLVRSKTLFVELEIGIAVPRCNQSINLKNIYFDLDRAEIKPLASLELDRVLLLLNENPTMKIEMGSHTDSRASHKYNEALSQRRAESTKQYLVNHGIQPSRIVAVGYGETRLTNNCADGVACSEDQHSANRRTEFKVICN